MSSFPASPGIPMWSSSEFEREVEVGETLERQAASQSKSSSTTFETSSTYLAPANPAPLVTASANWNQKALQACASNDSLWIGLQPLDNVDEFERPPSKRRHIERSRNDGCRDTEHEILPTAALPGPQRDHKACVALRLPDFDECPTLSASQPEGFQESIIHFQEAEDGQYECATGEIGGSYVKPAHSVQISAEDNSKAPGSLESPDDEVCFGMVSDDCEVFAGSNHLSIGNLNDQNFKIMQALKQERGVTLHLRGIVQFKDAPTPVNANVNYFAIITGLSACLKTLSSPFDCFGTPPMTIQDDQAPCSNYANEISTGEDGTNIPPCKAGSSSILTSSDDPTPSDPTAALDVDKFPTKIEALVNDVSAFPSSKSVVFSAWRKTLNIAACAFQRAGISCVRFDGETTHEECASALWKFTSDPSVKVILVTLSCSAVGLDLTAADRVYLMELQWNPTVEAQAVPRVHRMGKKRPVTTIRYVMENSYEEYIIRAQNCKKHLADVLLSSQQTASSSINGTGRLEQLKPLLRWGLGL